MDRITNPRTAAIGALGLMIGLAGTLQAATTSFAFNNDVSFAYTGAAAVGDPTDVWTNWSIGNTATPTLIANGISATVSGATDDIYYGATSFQTYGEILQQYIYSSGTLTIVLSGLSPSQAYNITGIASLDYYFTDIPKTFFGSGLNSASATLTNNHLTNSFQSGVNFATLTGIQPNAVGEIVLSLTSDVGLNALQIISAVPEPSQALLYPLIGMVCLARRKR